MPEPEPPNPPQWEQPERTVVKSDGSESVTKTYKGLFSALKAYADALVFGNKSYDTSGLPLRSINLTRTVGKVNTAGSGQTPSYTQLGTLRLEFGREDDADSTNNAVVLSTNWSMRHTQRIVSLMRRTGDSASMPHRGNLEAWRKEPDPNLYDAFQYRAIGGGVLTLSLPERAVAEKLKAGVDGAMRFYPTVQKVTTYTRGKIAGVGAGLAYIGTPGSPWDSDIVFGANPSATPPVAGTAAVWLKVGDDVTLDGKTGIQTRTESWMAAKSWDVNLYGTVAQGRWTELD
jgi:hypothetical protein